jgi:large subunit ribosomal protein L17
MRHRKDHRKLNRSPAHRKAMLRNLVTSLLDREEVRTTDARAKEIRRIAERMITLGKRGTLHAQRQALRTLRSKEVATKVFDTLSERYRNRLGGYTRILKLGRRVGDSAPMSVIQLVPDEKGPGKDTKSDS